MPGHPAGHRVDPEHHLNPGFLQGSHQVPDRVLGLGDGHAIAGHDGHPAGRLKEHGYFLSRGGGDLSFVDLVAVADDGHWGRREDHVEDRAVHGHAHDPGQDQATGPDQ